MKLAVPQGIFKESQSSPWWAEEGRRPYATKFSPFQATYLPTVQSSMPQHLNLPAIVTLLNDKFSAFKLRFSIIQPQYRKIIPIINFRNLLKNNELCFELINCFTIFKDDFTSLYALWVLRQIVWGSLKNKKRWKNHNINCHYRFPQKKIYLPFSSQIVQTFSDESPLNLKSIISCIIFIVNNVFLNMSF